jgi:hypothetical protein
MEPVPPSNNAKSNSVNNLDMAFKATIGSLQLTTATPINDSNSNCDNKNGINRESIEEKKSDFNFPSPSVNTKEGISFVAFSWYTEKVSNQHPSTGDCQLQL